MKMRFVGLGVVLLVSGCSTLDASNHEDYGTASPPTMYIHPDQNLEPQEEEEVQIHVLQNEQPYAVEDNVTLTVYQAAQEQVQTKTAETVREGVYTVTIRVPDDGVTRWKLQPAKRKQRCRQQNRLASGS